MTMGEVKQVLQINIRSRSLKPILRFTGWFVHLVLFSDGTAPKWIDLNVHFSSILLFTKELMEL